MPSTAPASQPVSAQSGDQLARAVPRRRRPRRGRRCRPRRGRAPAAGPAPICSPPNSCRARRMASTRSSSASPVGRLAEDVQTVADLDVLDLAQPAVDVQQHVVEDVLVGPVLEAEVVVHLRRPHQRPDLLADGGQLAGVERRDVGVLVEQLLEPGDVAVALGPRHRRDQVVDQDGVRAALGLGALARVVDQERVDQRQVAERGVGAARRRHAERLAWQPLQVAVLAEVHDRVGAETRWRTRRRASGRRPGSGGSAADPGRGRSRPGSRRIRAAAAP